MGSEIQVAVIGLARDEITSALSRGGGIESIAMSDIEAATKLLSGELAYIVGACESGGGAALAIPIALVGADQCRNLSRLGRPAGAEEIRSLIADGVRAFGVARDHVTVVVETLADELRRTRGPAR